MKKHGWKNGLVRFSEWFSRLAYINLLWIGFTLLGLVLFGFVPATVAMFTVLRRWMKRNVTSSLFKTYWTAYRNEFVRSNVAGLSMAIIGYLLYIDLTVYDFGNSMFQLILQVLVYIVSFVYVMAVVLFFPVYVQYELKWYEYIKLSLLMALSSPLRAIWMMIIGYGMFFVMSKFPGLLPFFLGSAIAYLWLMITLPLFTKLERQNELSNT